MALLRNGLLFHFNQSEKLEPPLHLNTDRYIRAQLRPGLHHLQGGGQLNCQLRSTSQAMAVVKTERKRNVLRRSQRNTQAKIVSKRGKIHAKPKRNTCIIRFPRSSYLTSCPLVSWYFNRKMRDQILSLHKSRHSWSPCIADTPQKLSLRVNRQRKPQPFTRGGPHALQVTLRQVALKKRAKWVVEPIRKRRRYSDNEIFYRLANHPSLSEVAEGTSSEGQVEDLASHAPGIPQPSANELQEAFS